MNENNINNEQQAQNGYQPPMGQQNYQQTYHHSGYPQSGMPYYPQSGYVNEKKSKGVHIAIIAVIAVLIVALTATLIVVLQRRNQQGMMPPPPPGMMSSVQGGIMLNGQQVTFDVIQKDGKTYLPVKEFTAAIDYECVIDGDTVKIQAPTEISTLKIGSEEVKIEDQKTGNNTSVVITTAPFKNNDNVYIYARDVALFLQNANVTYNSQMQSVEIMVGMGGPGGPPPGNMSPQQGVPMQQGAQQQGMQPEQQNPAPEAQKGNGSKEK